MIRNLIIVCLSVVFSCSLLWASSKPDLPKDGTDQKIQACAPTIKNDVVLSGTSHTVSVDKANCWAVRVDSDVKFRMMTSATKVGVQHTISGGGWNSEVIANTKKVNDYKYVNFSSARLSGTFRSDKP